MTTVAYKNGILAADTLSTFVMHPHNQSFFCPDCGSSADRVRDTAIKVHTNFEAEFCGFKIKAIGSAGHAESSRVIINLIRGGVDIRDFFTTLRRAGEKLPQLAEFTLLIVTDGGIFIYSEDVENPIFMEKPLDIGNQMISIGSGSSIAYYCNKAFNFGAVEAVEAAIVGDRSSGGNIHFVDCLNDPEYKIRLHQVDSKIKLTEKHMKSISELHTVISSPPMEPKKRKSRKIKIEIKDPIDKHG